MAPLKAIFKVQGLKVTCSAWPAVQCNMAALHVMTASPQKFWLTDCGKVQELTAESS